MTIRWIRLAPPALVGLLILAQAPPVAAQEAAATVKKERPKFKELAVTPAPEPIPAFRYSLLPSSARLSHGDAAPIYLRLRYGLPDEEWDKAMVNSHRWLEHPIQVLPPKEAGAIISRWKDRFDLLAIGARRATCNWNYPLDEQRFKSIELVMYDIDALRAWGVLLAVKARVEIAEGRFEDAARTLETGFAFGRHVGTGPFIINALIGVSIENLMLNCVEDWIAKPGSPNLYWALTALPRPLLDLREASERERRMAENLIPELADLDAPRSPAAWSVHFESMYNRMRGLARRVLPDDPKAPKGESPADKLLASLGADLAAYKQANLAAFRTNLTKSGIFSEQQIKAMTDDEATARGLGLTYQTVWDEVFKPAYLPYKELATMQEDETRNKMVSEAENGPLAVLAVLHPSLSSTQSAQVRLDHRVGLLRTVEAIRLYALGHEGKLPNSLEAVREVPIPIDPITGGAFSVKRDGDVATLVASSVPGMFLPDYKITIRKDDAKTSPPR